MSTESSTAIVKALGTDRAGALMHDIVEYNGEPDALAEALVSDLSSQGMVIVPREPSEAMLIDGSFLSMARNEIDGDADHLERVLRDVYCTMVARAETPVGKLNRHVREGAASEEIARLKALAYVPGLRRCAKCGLSLMSTVMDAGSGLIAPDDQATSCPNGCGPLWPVTERQAANEAIDRELKAFEQGLERAAQVVEQSTGATSAALAAAIRQLKTSPAGAA